MITVTDLFGGAGGSGLGAVGVSGVELVMAANHWQLAVDTHQANFPTTDHDCAKRRSLTLCGSLPCSLNTAGRRNFADHYNLSVARYSDDDKARVEDIDRDRSDPTAIDRFAPTQPIDEGKLS